jgi:hypothetical protein
MLRCSHFERAQLTISENPFKRIKDVIRKRKETQDWTIPIVAF